MLAPASQVLCKADVLNETSLQRPYPYVSLKGFGIELSVRTFQKVEVPHGDY
jgi:hypothetical protein